jgi:hypothetical protein
MYCIYSSMSMLWIRIRMVFRQLDPDPDPGRQNIEKVKKFHVLKYWMSFLVAKGFSYSLDVLHGGLGINKMKFLTKFTVLIHQNQGF